MINVVKFVDENKSPFFEFIDLLSKHEKKLLVIGDVESLFKKFTEENGNSTENLSEIVKLLQETVCLDSLVYLDIRLRVGQSQFYVANVEEMYFEHISIKEYLKAKEKFVDPMSNENILTLNFKPFYENYPSVRDDKNIGHGVEYLNKFLSSKMFNNIEKWKDVLFNFIRIHKYQNQQLLLNDRVKSADDLIENIKKALKYLNGIEDKVLYDVIKHDLQNLGFEMGLGENVKEIKIGLTLLDSLLNSPDHIALKGFLARIPMIFKIVVVSPHGYFGQDNILGMPDSGGQIVYILDQVKALEKSLVSSLKKAGLNIQPKIVILTRLIPNAGNTNCNERLEKVYNTKNTWILRVPFKKNGNQLTDEWISRFEIWPYLEEFAEISSIDLQAEFQGKPDLIIGNYSDGNLVAYLLSKKFGVTQCCIAHALEKSKYLYSDLYWKDLEGDYNFSLQFTADLIAMNSSNFQITSTYQEIAGTEYTVGQYETHKHFTLPGLFRVENGVDLYNTKFNIISPGVNEKIYFPYTQKEKRINKVQKHLTELMFDNKADEEATGELENPELTPIFSMARLDKNKNITSLVRWFGESKELQKISNLIIIAGKVDAAKSNDKEELEEINHMWYLINEFNLNNKIRWIGKLLNKNEAGECYRIMADRRGVFVQPGLFEGFGLTVLEAMISGLPVIATKYGGPLEIIQDKVNGFHIDPVNKEESKSIVLEVVSRINSDKQFWKSISENSIKRVNDAYNWKLYSEKLLTLSKVYGFWKYLTDLEMADMEAYLDIIFHMLYKPRAQRLLEKHNS
jgi:sucrose synthase